MTSTHRTSLVDVFAIDTVGHPIIQRSTSSERDVGSLAGLIIRIPSTLQSANNSMSLFEDQSPVECTLTTTPPPLPDINGYMSVSIADERWHARLQDKGCDKDKMPSKTYNRSQIPGIGPKGHEVFYYDLTSLAIDILSNMKTENDLGRGWTKVPKNKTEAKTKLVQVILCKRQLVDNTYRLDQSVVLDMCSTMWGAAKPMSVIHHNDRVRLFGIVMTLPENREMFGRLANGPSTRKQIDDIAYHPKQIYQYFALSFNNESIVIELPPDSYDCTLIEKIDPNDINRIRITRDCKFAIFFHSLI